MSSLLELLMFSLVVKISVFILVAIGTVLFLNSNFNVWLFRKGDSLYGKGLFPLTILTRFLRI